MVTRMFGFLAVTFLVLSVCITPTNSQKQARNVVSARNKIWRRGEIVYEFSSILDDSKKAIIHEAMQEIMNDTFSDRRDCVQFLPRQGFHENDDDYIYITTSNDGSCSENSVGMKGGIQRMYVGDECLTKTSFMANLLLIIGLYREHQRPDRDQYITVIEDNIKQEFRPLFDKIDPHSTDLLGLRYDFDSLSHFGPYAYAVNLREPTITANGSNVSFGNKKKLSVTDVEKIQKLYNCGIDTSHIENHPPFPVDCHFEQELCNIADDFTDDFQWLRQDTPLGGNGPSGDHSTGKERMGVRVTPRSARQLDDERSDEDQHVFRMGRQTRLLAPFCGGRIEYLNDSDSYLVEAECLWQGQPNQTGFYLFANGTSHLNMTARLLSAREIIPGDYCILLRYYIQGGDNAANLAIKVYDYVEDQESTIASTKTNDGHQGDGLWYRLQTDYSNLQHKWRVLVEGTMFKENGGIALDDIIVYPGVCS